MRITAKKTKKTEKKKNIFFFYINIRLSRCEAQTATVFNNQAATNQRNQDHHYNIMIIMVKKKSERIINMSYTNGIYKQLLPV